MRTEGESNTQNPVLETETKRKGKEKEKKKAYPLLESPERARLTGSFSRGYQSVFLFLKHTARNNQLTKKKGLIWFTVLELSVHVLWVLLFWVITRHYTLRAVQRKLFTS